MLCNQGDKINDETFINLHTKISYEGMHHLLEMHQVQRTWNQAEAWNQYIRSQNK